MENSKKQPWIPSEIDLSEMAIKENAKNQIPFNADYSSEITVDDLLTQNKLCKQLYQDYEEAQKIAKLRYQTFSDHAKKLQALEAYADKSTQIAYYSEITQKLNQLKMDV